MRTTRSPSPDQPTHPIQPAIIDIDAKYPEDTAPQMRFPAAAFGWRPQILKIGQEKCVRKCEFFLADATTPNPWSAAALLLKFRRPPPGGRAGPVITPSLARNTKWPQGITRKSKPRRDARPYSVTDSKAANTHRAQWSLSHKQEKGETLILLPHHSWSL